MTVPETVMLSVCVCEGDILRHGLWQAGAVPGLASAVKDEKDTARSNVVGGKAGRWEIEVRMLGRNGEGERQGKGTGRPGPGTSCTLDPTAI